MFALFVVLFTVGGAGELGEAMGRVEGEVAYRQAAERVARWGGGGRLEAIPPHVMSLSHGAHATVRREGGKGPGIRKEKKTFSS